MQFQDTSQTLSQTLQAAIDRIEGSRVSLRDLMGTIGEHGLLLICAVLALPFLIPVSIPGVSTVFGLGIILIAVAITLNRMPWLPRRILDRQLETEKLKPALQKGVSIVSRMDRYIRPRLGAITDTAVATRINGLALVFGGLLLMAPFGFVPFSNTLPAVAIIMLCFGMMQRDGVLILIGYLLLAATCLYFGFLFYGAYRAGGALLN